MTSNLMASIIIDNYNYEKFIGEAIESALNQTYPNIEVIVVDDGSTDKSREIISQFGDKIIPVLKQNGGQASAFNAGFEKSSGDIIFFLDSDDVLFPGAVENVISYFEVKNIAKVHWPLTVINEEGVKTGEITPKGKLPEGDFKEHALTSGTPFFLNPPTSGNAWSRQFLESVMPIPENDFKIGADTYLFETVPFFGLVNRIDQSLGAYRIHGRNNYNNKSFSQKLYSELSFYDSLFKTLDTYCKKLGLEADQKVWKDKSWFHWVAKAIEDIKKVIPEESKMILADEGVWDAGKDLDGRSIYPFVEKDGAYDGVPIHDEHAITELKRMYKMGVEYLVFTWITFWWLDGYPTLRKYLDDNYNCVYKNERVIIFDLKNNNS